MNHQSIITFIGAGNMGSSLAGGLIKNGYPAKHIWLTDPDTHKLEEIKNHLHMNVTPDNTQGLAQADVVVLAIKPQLMASIVQSIAPMIVKRHCLIISIAAGIREKDIQHWLGQKHPIVRVMPNTPALIGCGASALYANTEVTPAQKELAESILRAVSLVVWLENEKDMDAVTALSGSGPAYFFLVIEAMQQSAEKLGLSPEIARLLSLQTAYGAARMALESDKSAAELRQQVTSPGGTTAAAVTVFESGKLRELFHAALSAAKKRSEELAK